MPPARPQLMSSVRAEWMRCPRCPGKNLRPELINTNADGSDKLWWICENYVNCMFPLDMPSNIFYVTQTAYQKKEGFYPLPDIMRLPQKYRYMYPLTFVESRPPSRYSSQPSTKANSRNDTSDSSSIVSSEKTKSTGPKEQDACIGELPSSSVPSTSEPEIVERDNLDEDVEAAATESPIVRTVIRRKRPVYSGKSWADLIEKVAMDPVAAGRIINMEESELFKRMKEFFDKKYFNGTALTYKRNPGRVTYHADDVENCLREITQEEWKDAKRRIPKLTVDAKVALQTANSVDLLKSVGIDVNQLRRQVGEKVGSVMKGFNSATIAKRKKLEETRKNDMAQKKEKQQNQIHQSVSARLLHKKMRLDDERSLASTPATSCCSESFQQPEEQYSPAPVRFQLGYDDSQPSSSSSHVQPQYPEFQEFQEDQEHDDNWTLDLGGLYETLHAQNHPVNNEDPFDGLLFPEPLDGNNMEEHPMEEHLVEENSRSPIREEEEEVDEYAGFDDEFQRLESSNLDFVNDNFEF